MSGPPPGPVLAHLDRVKRLAQYPNQASRLRGSIMSRSNIRNFFFAALPVALVMIAFLSNARTSARSKPAAAPAKLGAQHLKPTVASMLSHQPFSFEENKGQTDPRVKFIARSPGAMIFVSPTELTFRLDPASDKPRGASPREELEHYQNGSKQAKRALASMGAAVRMRLVRANPQAEISGMEPLGSRSNYFIGNDPAKWHRGIKSYRRIRLRNVYPGIDVIYYGDGGRLEYDLLVAPHGDPSRVQFEFEGADHTRVEPNGDVLLSTAAGAIELHKAVVYQERDGKRREIDSHYTLGLEGKGSTATVAIKLASYDHDRPIVIDPTFNVPFSTIYGGGGQDQFSDGDIDPNRNVYAAGQSSSTDFPVTAGAFQTTFGGGVDAVVVKFDSTGAPLASTYVGGTGFDSANAIWVTSTSAFVVGTTFSVNFPVTDGSKLNLGKSTTNSDAFLFKISTDLSSLTASTLIGGSASDQGNALTTDSLGHAIVAGTTFSVDFPTTAGVVQPTINLGKSTGASDMFITIRDPITLAATASTLVGGSGNDSGSGVAFYSIDNTVFVGGSTSSTDLPETIGGFQSALPGNQAGAIIHLPIDLSKIIGATYFGGTATNVPQPSTTFFSINSVAVNASGKGLASGGALVGFAASSNETDIPNIGGGTLASPNGATDTFGVAGQMTWDLKTLKFLAAPEGSGSSQLRHVVYDSNGDLFAAGSATSKDFLGINAVQKPAGGSVRIAVTGSAPFASQLFDPKLGSVTNTAGVFKDNSTLLLGLSLGGLVQAPVSGGSTPIGNLTNPFVNGLAVDPTNNNRLYVTFFDPSSSSSKFYVSTDGGTTWNSVPNTSDFPAKSFFNEPLVDDTGDPLVLAGGNLFREDLVTTHWDRLGPPTMTQIFDWSLNPVRDSDIAAISIISGLWTSTDGSTFNNVQNKTGVYITAKIGPDGNLYVADTNGATPLLISSDFGKTFNNGGLEPGVIIRSMATSPVLVNGNVEVHVLVASQSGPGETEQEFSADGGMTFQKDSTPGSGFPSLSFTSSLPPFDTFSPDGSKVFAGGATNSDETIFDWDPEGNSILSSTIGGSSDDFADFILAFFGVTPEQLLAIMGGSTSSSDFPVPLPASVPGPLAAAAQSQLKGIANGVLVAIAEESATATSTASMSPTASASSSPSASASPTATATVTATKTATATATATPTSTPTATPGARISVPTKPITLKAKAGHSKSKHLKVKNVGTAPLDVSSTGLTAPLSSSGGGMVAPNQSTTITVTDSPTKGGSMAKQTLKILSNDPTKPEVDIQVTGNAP
jgi:hypothetical protein